MRAGFALDWARPESASLGMLGARRICRFIAVLGLSGICWELEIYKGLWVGGGRGSGCKSLFLELGDLT